MKRINDEVFYADKELITVDWKLIADLKEKANQTVRRRSRLCVHKDEKDAVHEMFIVHTPETYVPPHKHINKAESFHVVEGTADVVLFDSQGDVTAVISMGDYLSGKTFYYRISNVQYHTVIITSDVFVFHEGTKGPFNREETVLADWAPDGKDRQTAQDYLTELKKKILRFV